MVQTHQKKLRVRGVLLLSALCRDSQLRIAGDLGDRLYESLRDGVAMI